jgi:hypothetical protein
VRAKKTGNEQWAQREGQTLPARSIAFIVTMAMNTRLSAVRTAFGSVGLRIVLKALEVLLYRINSWHDASHRPVSSVVAI